MFNLFGSAWQGGLIDKARHLRLSIGYVWTMYWSGTARLSHTQMDMGIAFILRHSLLRLFFHNYLLGWSEYALARCKRSSTIAPHELALAYIRTAWVWAYEGKLNTVTERMELTVGLLDAISASRQFAQMASIYRHLAALSLHLDEPKNAERFINGAEATARYAGATDQIKKIRKLR